MKTDHQSTTTFYMGSHSQDNLDQPPDKVFEDIGKMRADAASSTVL
jgi:hypothetical protein